MANSGTMGLGDTPDEIPVVNRTAERYEVKRNAVFVTCIRHKASGDEEEFQGYLNDISMSGLSLDSQHTVKKDEILEFSFDFEGSTQVREGVVMWVRASGNMNKIGARFTSGPRKVDDSGASQKPSLVCTYKLNAQHEAQGRINNLTQQNMTFTCSESFSVGTMFEVIVDPWVDKANGIFNIACLDTTKVTDVWELWDIHRVAKVAKAHPLGDGDYTVDCIFVMDKKR